MSAFYTIPIVVVAAVLVLVLVAALEVGRWLSGVVPVGDRQFSTISTLILALVGLLLAFSFSMAAERYSQRRAATVQEANAIGTFWLRTALLPEPVQSEMRSRVLRYVDLHFEHRDARIDAARMAKVEAEVQRLQSELWVLLTEEAHRTPEALSLLLVTPALNAMIDDAATVLAANENRLPDALVVVLLLLLVFASVVVGYGSHAERRNLVLWVALVIVLGGTLVILIDMDRPRHGLIRAGVAPYVRLRESLQSDSPPR